MRSQLPVLIIVVVSCLVTLAPAQIGPSIGDSVAHPWYSGAQNNPTLARVPMGDHVVSVPGAPWVRLFFSDITLGPDDRIVMTGLLDGVSQTLDAINVKRWSSTSAYFNGDTVQVELLVAPASTASYEITRVAHGFAVNGATESICGAVDNRTPSTEQEVCRILTAANSSTAYGTGFIIDSSGCMLTAGHVAAAWGIAPVAEFNVPFSSASGAVNHPAPQDQYPIDTLSLIMVNGVIGDDWAVTKVFNDPAASQGFMTLAAALPAVNTTTRITGNGSDTTPNSTYNGIQQTDTGPLTAISGFELRYRVDTTGGNSGSPVRVNSSNLVYGIHTNGGCTATGGFNSGTSIFNTGLQAAIGTVCGGGPSCQPLTLAIGSQNSSCSPVTANFTLGAAAWNAVGVSSAGDWDITGGGTSSIMAGSACDYIIHDGRGGFTNVGSAIVTRAAGTASADIQHAARIWATLGSTTSFSWLQNELLRIVELNITTTGNYDFTINGLNLEWSLFSPGSNVWMTRAAAMVTATVGGGTVTVPGLTPGVYAVVISRDGGAGTPLPNVSVNISSGAPTCPASISSPAQGYSLDCGTQLTRQWTVTSPGSLAGGSWSLPCTGGNLPASWLTFVGTPTATTADVRVTVPPCTPAGVYSCPTGVQWTGTCLGTAGTTLTAPIAVTVAACAAANGPGASPTANPNPVCAGQSAVFAANAQNATSYSWTFPGGTPSTSSSQNPTVMFANPGTYTCTLSMNGSCAGTSGTAQVTVIVGPAMNVATISPATGDVTGGTFVTITGSGFTGATGARVGGALCNGFNVVSNTQITCCVPPSAVGALPGDVAVERSACVATLAGGFTYTGSAPVVTLLTPSSTSPTPSQLLLTVDGSGFTPSTVVHVDRQPVPTSWLTATQLVAVIPAGFATSPAGLTIEIADTTLGTAVSNPVTLRVGTQDNDGIITVAPLAFAPAALLTGTLQELTPGAPFTLVLEPSSPTPVTGFPTPADDYLLAVGSPAMFPLLDGLGVFLPPNPAATSNSCGVFSVNANAPSPTAGLTVTLQAAFADPSTAAGFRLTWPYPLDL